MRSTVSILILLGIYAWFRFGHPTTAVDYAVKAGDSREISQLASNHLSYHVPAVVRFLGADIYRPEGYFTQTSTLTPLNRTTGKVEALVKGLNIPVKIDAQTAATMGLEPDFSLWEQYGKWVLLLVVLFALYFVGRK